MPLLVLALAVSVGLATFLALLSPVVDQALDAGSTNLIAGSEVIVYLSPDLDSAASDRATENLGEIAGVSLVRPATSDDIASTRTGHEVGSDISQVWTVVLDGRTPQELVMTEAREVGGVEKVDAGVGERAGIAVELLQVVVPWLTGFFVAAGLILVVNVVLLRLALDAMRRK